MTTLVLVGVLGALALVVAAVVNRRTADAPTTPTFAVPQQLDRSDFAEPEAPWLMALFTSSTCRSCLEAREVVLPLDLDGLAVHDVEHPARRDLHDRYGIESVPTLLVADREGVVTWSFVGPPPSMAIVELVEDLGLIPPDDGVAVDFSI